jgi:hypothetical protein
VPPGSNEGALYEYLDDDKALKKGRTYYYWLEAVDIYGRPELYGPVLGQLGEVEKLLSFTATGGTATVTLNWETADETDNQGFNLYRATSRNGEQTQLNVELILSAGPGGAQYEYVDDDATLTRSETYYYWLEMVDSTGATELFGPVSAQLEKKVELLSFTATGSRDAITLNWETAAEPDNQGFSLYRGESEGGERTQLNVELIPSASPDGAQYEYVDGDKALRRNRTYYYWLEAVDSAGATELHGPVSASLGKGK